MKNLGLNLVTKSPFKFLKTELEMKLACQRQNPL
jgi:hypothetical protein